QPADMYTIRNLAAAAQQLKLPVVATNNVHYISPGQASQQRTLSAMRLNFRLDDLPPNAPAVVMR
ncbi:MAG: hypothetical protein KKD28_04230, partial [Chloroflexi bacterium]|nr:hypothetical protein [Chloroflexota bacterium]